MGSPLVITIPNALIARFPARCFVTQTGSRYIDLGGGTAETMNSGIEASILAKSVLHNIGVVLVGFCFALLGRAIDSFLGIAKLHSRVVIPAAALLLSIGFLLRVWATYLFYAQHMKVISLVPQNALITSGPYRISRNPLYLGGNVFIFLGAMLYLGSPSGLVLTAANILAVDLMIRREEKQLAQEFGEAWVVYANRVRRWL